MADGLTVTLLALASWRLSHLFTREDGPWDAFKCLRIALGAWWDIDTGWHGTGVLAKLAVCALCQSVWWGAILYAVWIYLPGARPVVDVLAISGAASIIELYLR